MNRSFSSPADNRPRATAEELKDLFTDPALKKIKNTDNLEKKKKASQSSSIFGSSTFSNDVEASVAAVKVRLYYIERFYQNFNIDYWFISDLTTF